jgi:hypothetical protein
MNEIIDDLLQLSMLEKNSVFNLQKEEIGLSDLILSSVETVKHLAAKKNIDIEQAFNTILNNLPKKNNPWKEKIQKLNWENINISLSSTLLNYYKIFQKFWKTKKQKILNNKLYQTEDYYNYLKSFNNYTNWVFTDIVNKNFENIKSYLEFFKKVVIKLKEVK